MGIEPLIHIVIKCRPSFTKSQSLVSIDPIVSKILPFKKLSKFRKKIMYGCRKQRPDGHTFLTFLTFLLFATILLGRNAKLSQHSGNAQI